MKLRIKRLKAGLFKQIPCVIIELNKFDLERAQQYNDKDLSGYTIEIAKPKRSTDQNRYMWELISQIADRTGLRPNDVYKQAIREAGAYVDMKIEHDAYDSFRKVWSARGVGWWVEIELQTNAEVFCRAYCGTSSYNSVEMSKLIDWVVEEARWHNIETDTPQQLAERKALWTATKTQRSCSTPNHSSLE